MALKDPRNKKKLSTTENLTAIPETNLKIPEELKIKTPNIIIPSPTPIPMPQRQILPTETNRVTQIIRQPSGAVFMEELKPSQQQEGIPAISQGLTKEQQAIESQNKRLMQVEGLLGQTGQITPEQIAQANIANPEQTLGASFQGAIPDILAGGATTSVLGGIGGGLKGIAGGIGGMAAGAGLGFAAGAISSILSELKEEEQQAVTVQYAEFTSARRDLTAIINDVNLGGDPIEAQKLFNYVLAKIDRTESNLKILEERDWLSKAKRRLVAIQAFNDGERQNIIRKFNLALLKPDKNSIINIPAEIIAEEI